MPQKSPRISFPLPRLARRVAVGLAPWLVLSAACVSEPGRDIPGSGGKSGSGSGNTVGSGSGGGSGGRTGSGGSSIGSGGATATGGGSGSGGTAGSGGTSTGSGGSAIPVPPSALPAESACSSSGTPGPRMLRRLSATEFAATIPDLFGDTTVSVATIFQDPSVLGFQVDANSLLVQDLNADQLMSNAEAIAHWAVTTPSVLSRIAPCTTTDDACQTKFINAFGRRAFRAPLAADRLTAYKKLFAGETTFDAGAEAVVSAMLQSPLFLYKSELGAAKGANYSLTPYEVATSLSYLLTGSMPDAALTTAADSWSTPPTQAQIDAQLNRLLTPGPALQKAVMNFMTGWIGLDRLTTNAKDNTVFMLTDALRADMMSETTNLIIDTFANNGSVGDLLNADHSFLNLNLAKFYGISTNGLGTSFMKVAYPVGGPRDRGILAHGSILNGYSRPDISSPTQRGHLVRSRFLCQNVQPPPPNLDTKLHEATGATPTTRSLYEQHIDQDGTGKSACSSCHTLMDPIGFAFENYDGFGQHRTSQNGVAIDSSNTIFKAGTSGMDVKSKDLTEMGAYLAGSEDVKACNARHWAYFAYGSVSWPQDGCTYDAIRQAAKTSAYSMKSVLTAIIHAPHFTTRVKDQ